MSTISTPRAAQSQPQAHTQSKPTSDAPHSASVLRQTQGLVGAVVLAGTAATYFIDPLFIILPAIVGAGLFISGFTGVCPMAFAIAKLPWNKKADQSTHECCGRCG